MMPLLDHFHGPLDAQRHWHAFHNAWATYISAELNRNLPDGFFAEANVQFGIEIDVAAFEEILLPGSPTQPGADLRGVALAPPPTRVVPFALMTDAVEIQVFHQMGGPQLAAAIELVSPANKDRPAHREAFVSKCAAYLHQGAGLLIVDVVTDRNANLHYDLVARLGSPGIDLDSDLYAVSYRPAAGDGPALLEMWEHTLALGSPLPTVWLWLLGGGWIRLDLEATYARTCMEQAVPRRARA